MKGLPRILKMKKSATFSMTDESIAKEVMAIIQEYNFVVIHLTFVNISIDIINKATVFKYYFFHLTLRSMSWLL